MVLRQRCSRGLLGLIALISMIGVVLLLANYHQENSPKKGIYSGLVVLPLILSTLCGVFGMFQKTDRARCILSSISLVAPLALGWCIWQTRKLATGSAIGVIYLFIVITLTAIGALNVALSARCGKNPNNRNRSHKTEGSRISSKSKKEMIELNVLKSKSVGSAIKNDKMEKNDDLEHSKAMENHDVEALLLNKHRPRGERLTAKHLLDRHLASINSEEREKAETRFEQEEEQSFDMEK
ncbi:hypothetical protein M3Y98_00584100 [Aphelenchoides besseyi]|nr:hypothetical protein M3Y98_00584100 [Aphelenchoides besseyi]